METETLHCFDNGEITVIAASLEEALQKWDEWTFTSKEQGYDDEEWEEAHDIFQIPDERLLTLFIEDELEDRPEGVVIDGALWKATAKTWAQSQGRGFLCSVEY